ncbi:hypothetical protein C1645_819386 [Glomus cerebriforme]|uniref:Uncharacterized protein n=1 Tax=Glomus cerebriforme TaxID=658196 RepID=A0A397TAH7_9GLOM|nr:hypothetical protein C1645_819386 [Glomus cerebriforme]
MGHLCAIDKEKEDSLNWCMNLLDKKLMYGTLHSIYKRALRKALQSNLKLLHLIRILKNFANDNSESESESEESNEVHKSNKENANVFQLQNPKIKHDKVRSAGTRRYKALNEKNQDKKTKQQRRCKKCEENELIREEVSNTAINSAIIVSLILTDELIYNKNPLDINDINNENILNVDFYEIL